LGLSFCDQALGSEWKADEAEEGGKDTVQLLKLRDLISLRENNIQTPYFNGLKFLTMAGKKPSRIVELSAKDLFTFSQGDVKAVGTYKGERVEFKVSSHALCLASPVWNNFICPPFPTLPSEVTFRRRRGLRATRSEGKVPD
jgi:hypothetical protein